MENASVEKSIIEKVKEFIGISEFSNLTDLYKQLESCRSRYHPDHFVDEESKKQAEEKFKIGTQLITDLNSYINHMKVQNTDKEIMVISENDFQLMNTQQKVIERENKIYNLEEEIKKYRQIIKELIIQNKNLSKTNKDYNYEEIEKLYKNNGKLKVNMGLQILFSFIYSVIVNLDIISQKIIKYIPFNQNILNVIILATFTVSFIYSLRQLIKNKIIEKNSQKIETTSFIMKFTSEKKLDDINLGHKVTDSEIFEFIKRQFCSSKKIFRIVDKIIGAKEDIIIEQYKNIFIYNLLEKQLIQVSKAKSLDREFYIYGTSWLERRQHDEEIKTNIVNDSDIDNLLNMD